MIKAWNDNGGNAPDSATVTDLSSLAQPGLGLNNGSSMAAGNELSDAPVFGAPGQPSEGTSDSLRNPNVTATDFHAGNRIEG